MRARVHDPKVHDDRSKIWVKMGKRIREAGKDTSSINEFRRHIDLEVRPTTPFEHREYARQAF